MAQQTDAVHVHSRELSLMQQLTQNVHADILNLTSSNNPTSTTAVQLTELNDDSQSRDSNHPIPCNLTAITQSTPTTNATTHQQSQVATCNTPNISSIDFNIMNKNNAQLSKLYISLYYFLRLFSIGITIFLSIMTINYAMGQIYVLTFQKIFCPDYTEDEVRSYNFQHNNARGDKTDYQCMKIHRPQINEDILTTPAVYDYDYDINVMACTAFSILAFILAVMGMYHLCTCCYDLYYHFIKNDPSKNPRILKAMQKFQNKSKKSIVKSSRCAIIKTLMSKWALWMLKHYYPDSGFRIFTMIISETMEIAAQSWALLIYGGVESVAFTFVLANEPKFVRSFAMIIGLNAIFTGFVWLLYVIKFKQWKCSEIEPNKLLKGTSFQSIIFIIDMTFDFAYTIFPFTLYSEGDGILFNRKALATLNQENGILFFAAFVAMVLLSSKCFNILKNFDPVNIEKRTQKIQNANLDLLPFIQFEYISNSQNTNTKINTYETWKKQQYKRRFCIGFIGLFFITLGLTIIFGVNEYMNIAWNICSKPSDELLLNHPELYYWSTDNDPLYNAQCRTKLTPFIFTNLYDNPPCNCRKLRVEFSEQYNANHTKGILKNWNMLTDLALHGDSISNIDVYALNLTTDCFQAKKLRSLRISRLALIDLDWIALSTFSELEVLRLHNSHWNRKVEWKYIGELSSLKVLSFTVTFELNGTVTKEICDLKELLVLDFTTTEISALPDCIGTDLTKLKMIFLRGTPKLKYVTPKLFNLPHITAVVAYWTRINISSIPDDGIWNKDTLTSVYLQTTLKNGDTACANIHEMSYYQQKFINDTKACKKPCDGAGIKLTCSAFEWKDGRCHEDCCDYDGGDCHQTCPCDRSLWFNGLCDKACNNALCAYDFGSCVDDNNDTDSECVESSGCLIEWIEDEWCDGSCQVLIDNGECNDFYDCQLDKACTEPSGCRTAWLYAINAMANTNEPKELIDIDEFCQFWIYAELYTSEFKNCTQAFPVMDINGDGYMSFWEALQIMAGFLGITQQKAYQLNCAQCLTDPTLYY